MAKYVPPIQHKVSQIVDVIFLVILSLGALFMPLWLGLAGSTKHPEPIADPTWESLGQNAVQAAQYENLGYTPQTANDLITARFEYDLSVGDGVLLVVVIVLYFGLLLKFSDVEYRDVISEKFDDK